MLEMVFGNPLTIPPKFWILLAETCSVHTEREKFFLLQRSDDSPQKIIH